MTIHFDVFYIIYQYDNDIKYRLLSSQTKTIYETLNKDIPIIIKIMSQSDSNTLQFIDYQARIRLNNLMVDHYYMRNLKQWGNLGQERNITFLTPIINYNWNYIVFIFNYKDDIYKYFTWYVLVHGYGYSYCTNKKIIYKNNKLILDYDFYNNNKITLCPEDLEIFHIMEDILQHINHNDDKFVEVSNCELCKWNYDKCKKSVIEFLKSSELKSPSLRNRFESTMNSMCHHLYYETDQIKDTHLDDLKPIFNELDDDGSDDDSIHNYKVFTTVPDPIQSNIINLIGTLDNPYHLLLATKRVS